MSNTEETWARAADELARLLEIANGHRMRALEMGFTDSAAAKMGADLHAQLVVAAFASTVNR